MSDEATAPETQDKPVDSQEVPQDVDQEVNVAPDGTSEADLFSEKFDRDSLPEEVRSQYDSMRSDYTRKTQELAAERKSLETKYESDPEAQSAVLKRMVEQHGAEAVLEALGYEFDEEDVEQLEDLANEGEETEDFDEANRDPKLTALLEEREQFIAQQEEAEHTAAINEFVGDEFEKIEKELGHELDEAEQEYILNVCIAQGPDKDGFPDVAGAFKHLQKLQAAHLEKVIASKQAQKVDDGVPGQEHKSFTNDRERVEHMVQRAKEIQANS